VHLNNNKLYLQTSFYTHVSQCQNKILPYVTLKHIYDTEDWRRQHNEELHDLYSSPNIIRVTKSGGLRGTGHVACMEDRRGIYKVLVGRPERKEPLGRPKHRWKDIKVDL
jgi:hypothetical protein